MKLSTTKKELLAQAEASEATLRAVWNTLAERLAPPDLHAADRAAELASQLGTQAARLSDSAVSAAETVGGKMKAHPYATGLIGAGVLLMLFGAARGTDANRKTVARAQEHPVASTAASLAFGAGIAALLPQNRTRLLALIPAAGVVLAQVQRWFELPAAQEDVPKQPAKKTRKSPQARAAAASTGATKTRKAVTPKKAAKPAAEKRSPRKVEASDTSDQAAEAFAGLTTG